MNRETWFRILQVAVVAPFIYTLSDEEKNSYFKLGLKLVAGAIIIMNVPPLLAEAKPLIEAAAQMKASADRITAQTKADAVEGEFTEAKQSG